MEKLVQEPETSAEMAIPSKGFQDLIFQNGIMGNCNNSCVWRKNTKY